uniref:PX domain-containing protein n=1 Tax=Canis lupus familiaris TaxID=9615 RepID=A0A8C0PF58_CANLF
MDARINAYIEEEVQRRLQDLHRVISEDADASADVVKDNEKLHNGTIQRKLKYERMVSRSLGANPDDLKDPIKISIPRYVLCGQGKDEHFEFEVKITVLDETWTVFRRYSRFREMHKTLKLKYAELATLEFPPKKLFGNKDERVIAERRSHLEALTCNGEMCCKPFSGSPRDWTLLSLKTAAAMWDLPSVMPSHPVGNATASISSLTRPLPRASLSEMKQDCHTVPGTGP